MTTKKKTSSRIPMLISPETYREIAEKQRASIHAIADKIERGAPLTEWEMSRGAARLRLAADLISTRQSKKGVPGKLCQFTIALDFWMMVKVQGMSKSAAREKLVEMWDCSTQSIKNVIKKHGDEALRIGGWISEEGESK